MINIINTKVLISGAMILAAAAIAIGATFAFFSDTETSTGNTFAAGAIDLKVDNTSYVTDTTTGLLVASPNNTWALSNLTNQVFFSFRDLKPGDIGEDTISLHVDNNDAWVCMAGKITSTPENNIVDPEADAGDVTDGINGGELQNQLNFVFWKDDGDNVFEQGEAVISSLTGAAGTILNGAWNAIADSANLPALTGATTGYIGKAWCFGNITQTPVAQGASTGPLVRGTGFSCSGVGSQNNAQTDGILADVSFYAVQSRNNGQFTCSSLPAFQGTSSIVEIDNVNDLAANTTDAHANPKWFMYNDTLDTIDNTLGSFVAGPGTPPNGTGSIEFTLGATPLDRKNIATYQFGGTTLSSISQMSYGAYSHGGSGGAGVNESPYFNFNVDFNGSNVFQKRLVYVPSVNGAVPQNAWNSFDMINGGNAKWVYSGAVWPTPSTGPHNGQVGVPGTTFRTWSDILADYPGIKVLSSDSWLGVRVGEPGPTGYIGNVDFFRLNSTTYDFDN